MAATNYKDNSAQSTTSPVNRIMATQRAYNNTSPENLLLACIEPPDIFVTSARPGVDKITQQRASSALGSSSHLRPLTPITNLPGMRSAPGSVSIPYSRAHETTFTTSSPTSEPPSPSLRQNGSSVSLHKAPRAQTPGPASLRANKGQMRSSSHPGTPRSGKPLGGTPHPHGKPSVKHLTCFWWKEKGDCRFKEEDCLYAHHDTGLYADAPRQVMPGEPAVAGRGLDRALRKINLSSSSLNTSVLANPSSSAPGTPRSPNATRLPTTPSTPGFGGYPDMAALQSDNAFLRSLVETTTKEKAVFVSTVETLQGENKTLKNDLTTLKADFERLKSERDVLRDVVNRMQHSNINPYGAIGTPTSSISRGTIEAQGQNKDLRDMLRSYGHSL